MLEDTSALDLARLAGKLALSKKAFDIRILRVQAVSSVCDYFVVASGAIDVQVKAIARAVEEGLREAGHRPHHIEGLDGGNWVLLDYVDVVIHVFYEPTRQFYALEKLWGDVPVEALADE
jgi:ribosome-associated protein